MNVSIHVPLAEHDGTWPRRARGRVVSIHVPLAEHDYSVLHLRLMVLRFQFTCPSRSTTQGLRAGQSDDQFQFTCPSRSTTISGYSYILVNTFQFTCPSRSTTSDDEGDRGISQVSIHVPLAEHDKCVLAIGLTVSVSIHVPLAEHDNFLLDFFLYFLGFNSRAPRGARQNG